MARTLLVTVLLAVVLLIALSYMNSPAASHASVSLSLSAAPAPTHSAGRAAPDCVKHSRSSVALGGVCQPYTLGVSLTCCGSWFGPVCG